MEDALSNYFMDFVMTALGTAVFTLIGFVWKISHKVSTLERTISSEREMRQRNERELRREIDNIIDNVDKNREWSTNRMMSIAKELPR
tara:strand:+ start:1917 stop:2180 length:264 start_codon:yes stop_codon:yes gene_type:complete